MRVSRADRSRMAEWWFTVDHVLVGAILAIVGAGLVLSLAASPAVAIKKGLPTYYFVERHLVFSAAGVLVMLAVSLFSPRGVRRLSLLLLMLAVGGMIAVHFVGAEINGARRWLFFGGHSIQPSEFAKPAFVVVAAWLFAESEKRHDMPALPLCDRSRPRLLAGLLLAEPDVGQTLLLCAVWGALYYLSGQPLLGAGIVGACGVLGVVFAYSSFDHVRLRVDRFFAPAPNEYSQLDRAMKSFSEGGFLGRGPGEGTIKTVLPDAHTDFIFAVVAEEYGVIACLVLVGLVRLRRHACAGEGGAGARRGDAPRHPGAGADVRPAGADQHGCQRGIASGQGHHAAVHLGGRLVDARGFDHAGHAAGADAAAPGPRACQDAALDVAGVGI